jgi:hypothetical protein
VKCSIVRLILQRTDSPSLPTKGSPLSSSPSSASCRAFSNPLFSAISSRVSFEGSGPDRSGWASLIFASFLFPMVLIDGRSSLATDFSSSATAIEEAQQSSASQSTVQGQLWSPLTVGTTFLLNLTAHSCAATLINSPVGPSVGPEPSRPHQPKRSIRLARSLKKLNRPVFSPDPRHSKRNCGFSYLLPLLLSRLTRHSP